MEVVKVVFFVYAIVSPVYPSESSRRMYYEPTLSNDKSCLCYPRNQFYTSVPEILDAQNNGLERLVIYIYKDVNTNEIKMYTPNSRKQGLIPDLPFEMGDGLITVNGDSVYDIFNVNPNRIVLNNPHRKINDDLKPNKIVLHEKHNKIPGDRNPKIIWDNTVVMPIGMEVGNIEETNHEAAPHIPVPDVFREEVVAIPQDPVNGFENNNMWTDINSADTSVKIRPNVNPWYEHVPNGKWHGNVHESFYYPGKGWEINYDMPRELHGMVQINPKGKPKHHVINTKVLTPNTQDVLSFVGKKQYLSFDKWFVKQMKGFENVNLPGDIDFINTMAFRMLIEKTLKENHMYVGRDGVITDSQGTVVDASNLELRPMLLGNPVESQNVLNGGSGDLKLPKDLPYLEGILVTLVYPPRVLGIIPLGKTTLSQVSRPKINKETSLKVTAVPREVNVANSIILQEDRIPKVVAEPAKGHKKTTLNKMARPVIKHEYVSQKMKHGNRVKKSHTKLIPKDLKVEDNDVPVGESRRLIKGNILKKLYEILSDSRQGYIDYESDYEEEPYFGVLPDFRIIGGNAATSSGAPVSNKGRSGRINH